MEASEGGIWTQVVKAIELNNYQHCHIILESWWFPSKKQKQTTINFQQLWLDCKSYQGKLLKERK